MGWFGRWFGRYKFASVPAPASMDTIRVVSAYAAALSKPESAPADAALLPYPKPRIKEALIRAISLATEPTMRAELKAAYVRLAEWQETVGTPADIAERVTAEGRLLADDIGRLGG